MRYYPVYLDIQHRHCVVVGGGSVVTSLQVSGPDLGGPGYHGNTRTIAVSDPVKPGRYGEIVVTVSRISGEAGYLSAMKIEPHE